MKSATLFSIPVVLHGIGVVAQVTKPANFVPEVKWQIDILNTLDTTKTLTPTDALVWDLDLFHLARHPEIIDFLRGKIPNVNIICYFNAGLAQPSDCDWDSTWQKPEFKGLLGKPYDPEQFTEELWVNIKNQTGIDLIKRRVRLAADLGCDGVDPDNIDGYTNDMNGENGTGWKTTPQDYVNFVTQLATQAHTLKTKRGFSLLIGQKNAPEIARNLTSVLDFAVLEDCKNLRNEASRAFCADFQGYITANKPVFSIEYPTSLRKQGAAQQCNTSGANTAQYTNSCAVDSAPTGGKYSNYKFSEILKIRDGPNDDPAAELNGCTQYCGAGQGKGVVVTAVNEDLDGDVCKSVPK
ncbi:glycoside hydrolase family 114 protein [Apodospora peruviana]|uniref:alpha-galactosidase n=1 Tax=Apodospora peruviana TaxID=516989 RepID=A0AAE0M357_9PEZI|nr:glycoside hydrolase family 114 protein [Apodospora peruviana]